MIQMFDQVRRVVFCMLVFAISAAAQTTVTTTSGGTLGKVTMFSGSPTNIENSAITQSGGNVGIGTTNPSQMLEVVPASGAYNAGVSLQSDIGGGIAISGNGSGATSRVGLFMRGSDHIGGAVAVGREDTGATWNTYMSFYTNNSTGGNVLNVQEKMRITGSGNVGIGTSNPETTLQVAAPSGGISPRGVAQL